MSEENKKTIIEQFQNLTEYQRYNFFIELFEKNIIEFQDMASIYTSFLNKKSKEISTIVTELAFSLEMNLVNQKKSKGKFNKKTLREKTVNALISSRVFEGSKYDEELKVEQKSFNKKSK